MSKNKSSKDNKSGLPGVLFIAVLFLFGVLVWIYLQTSKKDYTQYAVKFDSALSDVLVRNGISDPNILSQSRLEKTSQTHVWVEYFKEISLPKKTSPEKLFKDIQALSGNLSFSYSASALDGEKTEIRISFNRVLLYRMIFNPSLKAQPLKKVAIVIDDLGYTKNISGFLDLGVPITFAILPKEAYSKTLAGQLTKLKRPYILHMPLEPEGYPNINPGKAAILKSMTASEIKKIFNSNLESVPGVAGVSNHMGSAFSADADKMRVFLKLVKENKLFYFDSYTTPKSKAAQIAKELKMPFIQNRIFLDVEDDPAAVRKQLDLLLKQADTRGRSIAIGHIDKKNVVPALREYIPKFAEKGIEFVYLTDLLK
ncbi:MAG: divergent polysaccharide deacetylase family protein [Elusimicrobiota bacterium]